MNAGLNAALFYISVAAFAGGAVRNVRAAVERNVRDRIGIAMSIAGAAGLIGAVVAFLVGPKTVLPF